MRLLKLIIFISLITVVALAYVHQQVELVKLSYSIDCKEKKMKDILDRREGLGYNIDNLESPGRLEQVLTSRSIDVSFPRKSYVMKLAKNMTAGHAVERIRSAGIERFNIFGFLDFLSPKAEAQTKEK